MNVLSCIELPSAIPLGYMLGQGGGQAVLEELNASWRSAGSGVIFGHDVFGERFKAFSAMLNQQVSELQESVRKTVEATCCPNLVQEITCKEDLGNIPACMFIPILTMPEVRPLFEQGRISGWGVEAQQLPDEDVVGRLIKNGRFDTSDPNYTRDGLVEWTYVSGDPEFDLQELRKIETTREFISTFLEEQLGPDGDRLDFTDLPNTIGKLREVNTSDKNKDE